MTLDFRVVWAPLHEPPPAGTVAAAAAAATAGGGGRKAARVAEQYEVGAYYSVAELRADGAFEVVRDFKDKRQGLSEILRVLKPGGQLVICDAGKANWLHGLFGRFWMATYVQLVARIVTKQKEHPWRWLAKTYTNYGTNGYYRKMLKDVGFAAVSGRLLFPFLMFSRFRARKKQPE